MKNVLYDVKDRQSFRNWLIKNHNKESECWLFLKRGVPKDETTFWYLDAVEEALCFCWIDSVHKNVPEIKKYLREKNSPWSELNKEQCRRLEKLGLMTPAGRAVFPDEGSFIVDPVILNSFEIDT